MATTQRSERILIVVGLMTLAAVVAAFVGLGVLVYAALR